MFFLTLTVLIVTILTVPYSSLSSHISRTILAPFPLATYTTLIDKAIKREREKVYKVKLKMIVTIILFGKIKATFSFIYFSIFSNSRKKYFVLQYENSVCSEEILF